MLLGLALLGAAAGPAAAAMNAAPSVTVGSPSAGATVSTGAVSVTGTYADDVRVSRVRVTVRDTATGLYLTSSGTWQTAWTFTAATLSDPTARSGSYSASMQVSNAGSFTLSVSAVDNTGKVSAFVSRAFRTAAPAESTSRDVIAGTGLEATQETWTATTVDYNLDGLQDVWVGYHDQSGKLFRNNGDGTYAAVGGSAWPRLVTRVIDRHTCAWGDPNRDGLPDDYCAVGRTEANWVKGDTYDNELHLQGPGDTFTDVGTEWGVGDVCGRGRTPVFLDVNQDGFDDLFVANDIPRTGDTCTQAVGGVPLAGENKLYLNVAGTGYRPIPELGLNQNIGNGGCAITLDWNADGWDDVLVCGGARPYLYVNEQGTGFRDVAPSVGLTAFASKGKLGDIDGDRDLDFVGLRYAAGLVYYQENLGTSFARPVTVRSFSGGGPFALELADADANGTLDIYVVRSATNANPDDVLLLGQGDGRFTTATVPSAPGSGSDAVALQQADGRTAFLVLNGREVKGPLQLVALPPAP